MNSNSLRQLLPQKIKELVSSLSTEQAAHKILLSDLDAWRIQESMQIGDSKKTTESWSVKHNELSSALSTSVKNMVRWDLNYCIMALQKVAPLQKDQDVINVQHSLSTLKTETTSMVESLEARLFHFASTTISTSHSVITADVDELKSSLSQQQHRIDSAMTSWQTVVRAKKAFVPLLNTTFSQARP